eukprot:354603-Chlamydomonas_euryale.AAC.3
MSQSQRVRVTGSGPTKGMPVLSVARQKGSSNRQGAVTKGTPLRTVLIGHANVTWPCTSSAVGAGSQEHVRQKPYNMCLFDASRRATAAALQLFTHGRPGRPPCWPAHTCMSAACSVHTSSRSSVQTAAATCKAPKYKADYACLFCSGCQPGLAAAYADAPTLAMTLQNSLAPTLPSGREGRGPPPHTPPPKMVA